MGKHTQAARADGQVGDGGRRPLPRIDLRPPRAAGRGREDAADASPASGGAPLPGAARARLEASLGSDLGGVRVYDGAASQRAARRLGARAFAVGSDIHFGAGELRPDESAGMHLLAHEVAHTVQQGGGAPGVQAKREVSQPGDASEVEADRFADHVVGGGAMPALSRAPAMIQRQEATATPSASEQATEDFYNQVSAKIADLLARYQSLDIRVPATPPVAAPEATAEPTAEATAEPTAEATAESTAEPPPPPILVEVDTPYWNDKYLTYNANGPVDARDNPVPPQEFVDAPDVRGNAIAAIAARTGQTRDELGQSAVARGKGTPEEIAAMVQEGIDGGLVPAPDLTGLEPGSDEWKAAWRGAIDLWMLQVGVGVDCNGLVYLALMEIAGTVPGAETAPSSALDWHGDNRTAVSVEHLGGVPPPERPENERLGVEVFPLDLQPGDVMHIPGHVRIVMRVTARESERIEFETAESTASGRMGADDTNTGPRPLFWQWRNVPELSYRFSEADAWTVSTETPNYRRHIMPAS